MWVGVVRRSVFAAMVMVWAGASSVGAVAADLWGPSDLMFGTSTLYRPDRWEVRAGGYAHGLGGVEKGSADLGVEIVSPRLFPIPVLHEFFSPRFHAGGIANFNGRTSYGYAGLLFTYNLTQRIFLEPFVGIAVSNGVPAGDATHNAIGCTTLIHSGGNIGFRIDQNWSVMFTLDHISNGNLCDRNIGVNNYGGKIGYTF